MTYLMLRYNLKAGVSADQFESWVRETDQPTMRGIKRITNFETFRVSGLLMGEGAPSQSYFEIFEIDDFAGFTSQDLGGEIVQSIMGEFMGMVENPEFNIAERI